MLVKGWSKIEAGAGYVYRYGAETRPGPEAKAGSHLLHHQFLLQY